MKVPLSWLREYIEIKEPVEKLASDLQLTGNKVDNIEKVDDDFVFDFEVTPNRPDTLSMIGIAREVSAIYNRPLVLPPGLEQVGLSSKTKVPKLTVEEKSLCPGYSLGVVKVAAVGQSPSWIRRKLEKVGIRSLNNVVDITNFVMHETGQPMHAFDLGKIKGSLTLRSSKKNEGVTTLDGVERSLAEGSIIIEDEEKIIDLAGLMGGKNSQVDENTTTLLIHVPIYNPLKIRSASQYLGLRSEASNRFEKKLDPNGHRFAFERAVNLLVENAGGVLVSEIESIGYPESGKNIESSVSDISGILGLPLSTETVVDIFKRLHFLVKVSGNGFLVQVPTFRTDVRSAIDLVEEVGRLYGYNNFPKTIPKGELPKEPVGNSFEINLKRNLALLGLKEIYTNSLTSAFLLEKAELRPQDCLKVMNRLVVDYEYLRPNLIIGLLEVVSVNVKNYKRFAFFELGKIFKKERDKETDLPVQPKMCGAIFLGYDFREAKGVVESVLSNFNLLEKTKYKTAAGTNLVREGADIFHENLLLGKIGQINPEVAKLFDINSPCFVFEINLAQLEARNKQKTYAATPKFPTVRENVSIFVPENKEFSDIQKVLISTLGNHLYSFDLLEDTRIEGQRSLLVAIEYFDRSKTLNTSDIKKLRDSLLENLEEIGVKPRLS